MNRDTTNRLYIMSSEDKEYLFIVYVKMRVKRKSVSLVSDVPAIDHLPKCLREQRYGKVKIHTYTPVAFLQLECKKQSKSEKGTK